MKNQLTQLAIDGLNNNGKEFSWDVGNTDMPITTLIDMMNEGELHKPKFQRDFIWTKEKIQGWINTIISKKAIGVIVTYEVQNERALNKYIADGLQRLTATKLFIANSSGFGFTYSQNEAQKLCKAFFITVQHRHYKDHEEAMKAFQNLNRGTALAPAEFFKGELTLMDLGEEIYKHIPEIININERVGLVIQGKGRRVRSQILLRDCLALFLQYISGYKKMVFWNITSSKMGEVDVVERQLANFIKEQEWSLVDLDKAIKNFDNYISSEVAVLNQIRNNIGRDRLPFGSTLFRWLLHLSIWRKNNGKSVDLYIKMVTSLLNILSQTQIDSFSSLFAITDENGMQKIFSLHIGDLNQLSTICQYLKVPLAEKQIRKNKSVPKGYHHSHKKPISLFGDGETFLEPAIINIARGAKECE